MNPIFRLLLCFASFVAFASSVCGQVPQLINYQGRVAVDGVNFDGSGQFKFALVNGDGSSTYWSNDGSSTSGSEPTAAVTIPVNKGLYSVLLGDATLNHMTIMPATVFVNGDVHLRVWFNDGVTGFQQLTPDRRIAAVGYAMMADSVVDGAITTVKIADGAVTSEKLAAGVVQSTNLAAGAVGSAQLAPGLNLGGTTVGTFSGNLTGDVAGNVSGNSANFTGVLEGDVTGRQGDTVVSKVGSSSAANIQAAELAANAASSSNLANTIIKRDENGGFEAATVTAQSFVGDGVGITGVLGAVPWTTVDATNVSAEPDRGYILTNSSHVIVNLPATADVGSVLKITGTGIGGWSVVPNGAPGVVSGAIPSGHPVRQTVRSWRSIASSADGAKLAAAPWYDQLFTSSNYGGNWSARQTSRAWIGIASSSDGTKLVTGEFFGKIYTSTDSGVTWTERNVASTWWDFASSDDGGTLAAVGSGSFIFVSTNSGVTWTARGTERAWRSIDCSSDGSKLVAVAENDAIYVSTDLGLSWTARESNRSWSGVASSSDGNKMCAVVAGGRVYVSSDAGATWSPHDTNRNWSAVASSSDGTKLVAVVNGGQIYTSSNSGISWTPRDSNRAWHGVACSNDGMRIAAVVDGGQIYTFDGTASPLGSAKGEAFSAIELQHVGGGTYVPLSSSGSVLSY